MIAQSPVGKIMWWEQAAGYCTNVDPPGLMIGNGSRRTMLRAIHKISSGRYVIVGFGVDDEALTWSKKEDGGESSRVCLTF